MRSKRDLLLTVKTSAYNPRKYPMPAACISCDFLTEKEPEKFFDRDVTGFAFCTAFDLHLEYIPDIIENEPCYKAKCEGIS
jgi:hypothetical protein